MREQTTVDSRTPFYFFFKKEKNNTYIKSVTDSL